MIQVDDLVWRVDNHYLGPPGKTLPIPIRTNALWVGLGIAAVLFIGFREIFHFPFSLNLVLIVIFGAAITTVRVMRRVGPERPVRAVLRAALNDLRSPRRPKAGQAVTLRYLPSVDPRHAEPSPDEEQP
ncbi:hypothetical protein [Nocardia wallacei]|uniref:hypothetical protein n=1 Tax=Nocardia wallacei TaxID=480035 RepID=UPI002454D779|nr:hypothetical protein [Nocardia wallacei]